MSQPFFYLVNAANEQEDAGSDAWIITAGFFELPTGVREAGHRGDVQIGMALDEGAIGAQAVALHVAVEGLAALFIDEDAVEAGVGAAFVPVVEDAVFGVVIDPEVSGGGFAVAGFEAANGGLVDLEVVGLAKLCAEDFVKRMKGVGEVVVPGAHEVAGELDAVGGFELPLLAVKGAVVAELLGQEVGSEGGCEHAAGKQAGSERRGEWDGIKLVFAHMGQALDDFEGEGGGLDVQALADFFAKQAELVGGGENVGMGDLANDGGKAFERFAQLVGAAVAGLGRGWRGDGDFSRQWLCVSIGGFGLFCLVLEELHEELVVVHLFALRAVDALE